MHKSVYHGLLINMNKKEIRNKLRKIVFRNRKVYYIYNFVKIFINKGFRSALYGISYLKYQELPSSEFAETYESFYQDDMDFSGHKTDIKAIALYLPQFHEIPENNEWWGKGFTEWVNTRKSKPRFEGHYQPREPHADIGYYSLDNADTIRNQAKLAKKHGIFGFCIYYYWFSGKKLLETPIELIFNSKDIDINYCLCWANENWSRAWDGQNNNVLIGQNYSSDNDVRFIEDLKKYIEDKRYIRIDSKPLISVYRIYNLPDPANTIRTWRKWCRDNGIGEICIAAFRSCEYADKFGKIDEIDYEVEFVPHGLYFPAADKIPSAYCYDYRKAADYIIKGNGIAEKQKKPVFRSVMFGWDNSSRRAVDYSIWAGFSIKKYYEWVRYCVRYTRRNFDADKRFIFINAWNEWAEGTYLEPDVKFGYTNINTTSKAIFDEEFE